MRKAALLLILVLIGSLVSPLVRVVLASPAVSWVSMPSSGTTKYVKVGETFTLSFYAKNIGDYSPDGYVTVVTDSGDLQIVSGTSSASSTVDIHTPGDYIWYADNTKRPYYGYVLDAHESLDSGDMIGADVTFKATKPGTYYIYWRAAFAYDPQYSNWARSPTYGTKDPLGYYAYYIKIVVEEPDNPPTVYITSPSDGSSFAQGTEITIQVSASDDKGIKYVKLYVDGTYKNTDYYSPYSFTLDTSQFSIGTHTIMVKAYDTSYQTATDSISIIIREPNPSISWTSMPSSGSTKTVKVGDEFTLSFYAKNTGDPSPSGYVTIVTNSPELEITKATSSASSSVHIYYPGDNIHYANGDYKPYNAYVVDAHEDLYSGDKIGADVTFKATKPGTYYIYWRAAFSRNQQESSWVRSPTYGSKDPLGYYAYYMKVIVEEPEPKISWTTMPPSGSTKYITVGESFSLSFYAKNIGDPSPSGYVTIVTDSSELQIVSGTSSVASSVKIYKPGDNVHYSNGDYKPYYAYVLDSRKALSYGDSTGADVTFKATKPGTYYIYWRAAFSRDSAETSWVRSPTSGTRDPLGYYAYYMKIVVREPEPKISWTTMPSSGSTKTVKVGDEFTLSFYAKNTGDPSPSGYVTIVTNSPDLQITGKSSSEGSNLMLFTPGDSVHYADGSIKPYNGYLLDAQKALSSGYSTGADVTFKATKPGTYYIYWRAAFSRDSAETSWVRSPTYGSKDPLGYYAYYMKVIVEEPKPPSIDSVEINYYSKDGRYNGPVFKVTLKLQGDTNQVKKVTLWWDDKNDMNFLPTSVSLVKVNSYGYYEGIMNLSGHEGHDIGYHVVVELQNGSKIMFPKGWSSGSDDAYLHIKSPIELKNVEVVTPTGRSIREFYPGETLYVKITIKNRLNVTIPSDIEDYIILGLVHVSSRDAIMIKYLPVGTLNPREEKTITVPVAIPKNEWTGVHKGIHLPMLSGLYAIGAELCQVNIGIGDNMRSEGKYVSGIAGYPIFLGNSTISHYYPSITPVLITQDSLFMIEQPGVSYIEQIADMAFHLHLDKRTKTSEYVSINTALEVAATLHTAMEYLDAVKTTGELIEHINDLDVRSTIADVIGLATNDFVHGIISGTLTPDEQVGDSDGYDMTIVKGGLLGSQGALLFHDTTPVEVTKVGEEKAHSFFWGAVTNAVIAILTKNIWSAVEPYGKEIFNEAANYQMIYSKLEGANITYVEYKPIYFNDPIHVVDNFDNHGDYIGYTYGINFQNRSYTAGSIIKLTVEGSASGITKVAGGYKECTGSCPSASSFGLSINVYLKDAFGNKILIYQQPTWPDASPSSVTLRIPFGKSKLTIISARIPNNIPSGDYTLVIETTEGYHTNNIGTPYNDQMFIDVKTKTLTSPRKIYIDAPPTVSFISPNPSQHVKQGDNLQITVNATDAEGLNYVELYLDGDPIKNWTSSPYTYPLDTSSLSVGAHTLKAVAVDTAGQKSETSVTFYIDKPNVDNPPTIQITNKDELTSKVFVEGETIVVKVSAGDDKGVTKIVYKVNGNPVKTHTSNKTYVPDGALLSKGFHIGENIIQVVAYDTSGQTGTDEVTVTVKADEPPTVTIVSPPNNTQFHLGDTINLVAKVSDDLSLSKIEVYRDLIEPSNRIASVYVSGTSYQYSATIDTSGWKAGVHRIYVVAYDNKGQKGTASVNIILKLRGDINGDGRITAIDALLYLKYAVGLDISPYRIDPVYNDLTGDGKITIADALKALRIAAGLEQPV